MGKKTKEHRKRVAARAKRLKSEQNAAQNFLKKQIEEFKQKYEIQSGTTENQ
jgi:hypothetical protein